MLTLPARRGDRKQVLTGKRPLGAVATLSSTVRPRQPAILCGELVLLLFRLAMLFEELVEQTSAFTLS